MMNGNPRQNALNRVLVDKMENSVRSTIVADLRVVVIAWNAGDSLERCIAAVHDSANEAEIRVKVTVVDNGANGAALAAILAKWSGSAVVGGAVNRGFAAACNLGAAELTEDYVLFMNPDVFLDRGALAALIAAMHSAGPELGAVGPQLRTEAGVIWRSCARLPTPANTIIASMGPLARIAGRRASTLMSEWHHQSDRNVEQLIGAAIMVRRDVFIQVRGFDENFFVYYEEVDLCKRIRDAGRTIRFIAAARAVHVGGGSSGKVLLQRSFYNRRSRILYSKKHMSAGVSSLVILSTIAFEPFLKGVGMILSMRLHEAVAVIGATARLSVWLIFSHAGKSRVENRRP
jgi:N-acetylglucosaminyl-diphospho-decaprenol L-rhamnosyltransferase